MENIDTQIQSLKAAFDAVNDNCLNAPELGAQLMDYPEGMQDAQKAVFLQKRVRVQAQRSASLFTSTTNRYMQYITWMTAYGASILNAPAIWNHEIVKPVIENSHGTFHVVDYHCSIAHNDIKDLTAGNGPVSGPIATLQQQHEDAHAALSPMLEKMYANAPVVTEAEIPMHNGNRRFDGPEALHMVLKHSEALREQTQLGTMLCIERAKTHLTRAHFMKAIATPNTDGDDQESYRQLAQFNLESAQSYADAANVLKIEHNHHNGFEQRLLEAGYTRH